MLMTNFLGENLFDGFFSDFARPERRLAGSIGREVAVMRTDVKESNEGFELDVDLPGYSKEDIKAELKDGTLTISASTNTEKEDKDKDGKFIRRERFCGNCSRSFYVGENLEQNDIKAKFENGILKLFVPKKENKPEIEEAKYIAIEG